ncbi:hypothetical protein ACFY36_00600 [Actinoplanes sp. NPDC000266]
MRPGRAAIRATGAPATFTVRHSRALRPQRITSFIVRSSVDDGATWQTAKVSKDLRDTLPKPPAGGFLSLRVTATVTAAAPSIRPS